MWAKADANRSVQKRAAWILAQALSPQQAAQGLWLVYLELLPLLNEYGLHLIQVCHCIYDDPMYMLSHLDHMFVESYTGWPPQGIPGP